MKPMSGMTKLPQAFSRSLSVWLDCSCSQRSRGGLDCKCQANVGHACSSSFSAMLKPCKGGEAIPQVFWISLNLQTRCMGLKYIASGNVDEEESAFSKHLTLCCYQRNPNTLHNLLFVVPLDAIASGRVSVQREHQHDALVA